MEKSKKSVINPQSKDEECFKWAIISALHHKDIKHHPERISLLRPYEQIRHGSKRVVQQQEKSKYIYSPQV